MTTKTAKKTTKTTFKLNKGDVLTRTGLKVMPGEGAIEFARQYFPPYVEHYEGLEIAADLIDGFFEGVDDPRVRRCNHCGYFYRDKTKNNSSLVCSDDCKNGKDGVLQWYRRESRKAGKPRRLSWMDMHYATHNADTGERLEYPFWISDWHMFEYDRKHKAYSFGDNFEQYVAQQKLKEKRGGKRKRPQLIDYDGYLKPQNIAVKFITSGVGRSNGKLIIIKRSKSEIAADLLERYGEKHLHRERIRAQMAAFGKYKF